MLNLKSRSDTKELLDNDDIPKLDLYQNLKELNFINTWLGGHNVTLKGFNQFNFEKDKAYTLIDIVLLYCLPFYLHRYLLLLLQLVLK